MEEEAWSKLLTGAGRVYEAAEGEIEKGREAVRQAAFGAGLGHLDRAIDMLDRIADEPGAASLLVSTAILASQLRFLSGREINAALNLLEKGRKVAERLGDRRSRTLIGLHHASFYFLTDQLEASIRTLDRELEEVKKLGDEDIMKQSAEFFGLYHYLHGRYREAVHHFEIAAEAAAVSGEEALSWPVHVYLGYSSACLGRFHRAVGLLDANRKRAMQNSNQALAGYFRSILGVVLLLMNKKDEAAYHIRGARSEALAQNNVMVRMLCDLAEAYDDARQGRLKKAYENLARIFGDSNEHGRLLRQYPTPLILELLYILRQNGFPPLVGFDFSEELTRLLAGPNVHLKGVAYRIKALEAASSGDRNGVLQDLLESEAHLISAGDPIELGRTRVELARSFLKLRQPDQAGEAALKAWENLSGHRPDLFPQGLKFLLEGHDAEETPVQPSDESMERLFDLLGRLVPTPNLEELLGRLVEALNQFFQAERGGLLWFSDDKRKKPDLRAARNLTREEVFSAGFRSGLILVFKSFREKRPIMVRSGRTPHDLAGDKTLSVICLPIVFRGKHRGVLYHDNSYLEQSRRSVSEAFLRKAAARIGDFVERILEHGLLLEERNRLVSAQAVSLTGPGSGEILTGDPGLKGLLATADRAAASGATVLITGETGVGKELLAKRIHMASPRASGPFIAVDLAGAPENLVESELFGHEKGAFTGADAQRIGRLEMAHQGTLFIDELGEIPLSIQVKLLRVLQEKSFCRVGGSRVIASDFRLAAATNRNLEREVAAGRFRRDLFYRLNVIPLRLPPLRERGSDPIMLANHFIELFSHRFSRPPGVLTADDEHRLLHYSWPGNVRELKNVIERAVLLSDGEALQLNLPESSTRPSSGLIDDSPSLDELQRRYINIVLEKTGGRIGGPGGAAEVLGMKRTSLYARMRAVGLKK